MMYSAPEVYRALMEKVSQTVVKYLNAQIKAGAQAVQVFDTWGGILSQSDYEEYVLPFSKKVIAGLDKSVPIIHFVKGAGIFLETVKEAGGDVMGLDWHVDLGDAVDRLWPDMNVQGNMDPTLLLGPRELVEKRARDIVNKGKAARGHVFNLGHGVLPMTPVDNVVALVDVVHEAGLRDKE